MNYKARWGLYLTLLLCQGSQVLAWHHDGIPLDAYQNEPLANALYDADELEEHVQLIFDANENDTGSPDAEYLDLFGECRDCPTQLLDFISFVACIRMLEPHKVKAPLNNCQHGLAPLKFASFKTVWAANDANPFKVAVTYFLAYLRLHQNRLEIPNLIEY